MKIALFYFFLGYLVFKRFKRSGSNTALKKESLQFLEVSKHIERLNDLKTRIETIERMIADIEMCAPDQRATAFNISMPGAGSSYELIANNSDEKILELLNDERKKLRSSLQSELEKGPYRCYENSYGNITGINREGSHNE